MSTDILLPYWGEPGYLKLAVDSVLAQTDPDWRLVVVDDNYPDPSAGEYVRAIGDPRVSYHRNATTLGVAGNFSRCLELATADRVVFMGSDDILLPHYLQTVGSALERFPGAQIVQPGVDVIDESGRRVRPLADVVKQRLVRPRMHETTLIGGEPLAARLLTGDWLYWPSLSLDRRWVERFGFRLDLEIILDLALVLEMALAGGRLVYEPTVAFQYRRHRASASSETAFDGSRFTDERRFFDAMADRMGAHGWRRARSAARHRLTSRANAATLIPGAVARRDTRTVRELARHAMS